MTASAFRHDAKDRSGQFIRQEGIVSARMTNGVRIMNRDDAGALLELQRTLDKESEFMLLEPGERGADPPPLPPAGPSYVLGVFDGGTALGYVDVTVPPFARARRTGYVVMGVRAASAGRGIGTALLEAAVAEARQRGLWRLELTVMEHNRAALNLYLRCGFQVEGLRRAALDIGGAAAGEYYMGLLLR
jgi:ribosomal protein S18 acetylase RimI-like enzyme